MNNWIPDYLLQIYVLQKDLPGLKKGILFKPCKMADKNGKPSYYYPSLTDEEHISKKYQDYKFRPEFVEQNEEWFKPKQK